MAVTRGELVAVTFSTKRRIKYWLSLVVLLAGVYVFALLGAGFYAMGLSMMSAAVFSRGLWPEIWGRYELKGMHQNYAFAGVLTLGVALLLFAGLQTLSAARSGERSEASEARNDPT